MILKLQKANNYPVISNRFYSGKRLVKTCRAFALEEFDFFCRQSASTENLGYEKVFNFIEKVLPETERRDNNLFYKFSTKISNKFMDKIRRLYFEPCSFENTNDMVLPGQCTPKKLPNAHNDNIISHNRDLITDIIGLNTSSAFESINKYRKLFAGSDLKTLFIQKLKILGVISEYMNRINGQPDFVYLNSEIKYLRSLAIKYDAIDCLMLENGIRTKAIETILLSNMKIPSSGELLPNGDVVIERTTVFDKNSKQQIPTIVTFANTNIGYRFKLYRSLDNLINEKDKLREKFYHLLRTDNVCEINNLNKKITNEISNTGIAEVFIDIKNRVKMQQLLKENSSLSQDVIDKFLGDDEKFYYIHDLLNFNPDKYFNISRELIFEMKKFGIANNINAAFIEALAYGKVKHSPVGLYLRAGCTPLSETREEVENQICAKRYGYDYKKNIWLKYDIYDKINSFIERSVL